MSERILDALRRVRSVLAEARSGRADAARLHERLAELGGAVCFAGLWLEGLPTNDDAGDSWHARVHACLGRAADPAQGTTLFAARTGKASDLRAAAKRVRAELGGLLDALAESERREGCLA